MIDKVLIIRVSFHVAPKGIGRRKGLIGGVLGFDQRDDPCFGTSRVFQKEKPKAEVERKEEGRIL